MREMLCQQLYSANFPKSLLDYTPGNQRAFQLLQTQNSSLSQCMPGTRLFAAPERPQQEPTAATSGSAALAARLPGHSATTQPRHKLPCFAVRNRSRHT